MPSVGPAIGTRAADPQPFFERVWNAARRHGVSRLADVTRLDRIGFPVWQAVRPAGRSLSVHQGKGATPVAAKIGALCEAIESDHAERAVPDGPCCSFAALDPSERAPEVTDYAKDRRRPPAAEDTVRWCSAIGLVSGKRCWLPHQLVSLDMTERKPSIFDRSSSGLSTGASESESITTALYEVIERDAVGEWDRSVGRERLKSSLRLDSIPFEWFGYWHARLADLGIELRAFAPPALAGLPCFIVSIDGEAEFGAGARRFSGTAVHANAELALFKALAEALQSRLTFIVGVRDDILPSDYAPSSRQAGFRPLPADLRQRRWEEFESAEPGWEPAAERLAALGYGQIVMKRLDAGDDGLVVAKLFVPGLGSLTRQRRPNL